MQNAFAAIYLTAIRGNFLDAITSLISALKFPRELLLNKSIIYKNMEGDSINCSRFYSDRRDFFLGLKGAAGLAILIFLGFFSLLPAGFSLITGSFLLAFRDLEMEMGITGTIEALETLLGLRFLENRI